MNLKDYDKKLILQLMSEAHSKLLTDLEANFARYYTQPVDPKSPSFFQAQKAALENINEARRLIEVYKTTNPVTYSKNQSVGPTAIVRLRFDRGNEFQDCFVHLGILGAEANFRYLRSLPLSLGDPRELTGLKIGSSLKASLGRSGDEIGTLKRIIDIA